MGSGRGIGASPYLKGVMVESIPTSTNATVQAWLDKIGTDGYAYPTQAKVDIYTTAWDYADANGLTSQFDLVGLSKVENIDLIKIPFIHSAGAATRFTINNVGDLLFRPTLGISNDPNFGTSDGYIDLNFIASTHSVASSLNNTSYGAYVYRRISEGNDIGSYVMGVQKTTATATASRLLAISSQLGGQVNSNASNLVFSEGSTDDCLISNVRTTSNNTTIYLNGASIATSAAKTSTALPPLSMFLLNTNVNSSHVSNGGYNNGATAFFYYGSGAINQTNLNTFVNLLLA